MVDAVKHPAVVKLLIEHGANLRRRITWRGGRTGTWFVGDEASALHYAVQSGNLESVKLLIAAGLDPNAADDQGQTPLHIGITFAALEALNKKIDAERAQNVAGAQVQTRLPASDKSSFAQIIEYLVQNDASLSFTDKSGKDSLKLADAIKAPKEICQFLRRKQDETDAVYLRRCSATNDQEHGVQKPTISDSIHLQRRVQTCQTIPSDDGSRY